MEQKVSTFLHYLEIQQLPPGGYTKSRHNDVFAVTQPLEANAAAFIFGSSSCRPSIG